MNALALLRLQLDWGADEALEPLPVDRRPVRPPAAGPSSWAATRPADALPATLPATLPPARPPAVPERREQPAPAVRPAAASLRPDARARRLADAAPDIAALRAAVAGFDGCGLRDTATSLVFAEGDPAAGVVIVGEVPDAEEDRTGRPFAGRPGELLDRMLDSIGLHRDRVLLVPLIPWRPPGNRPPGTLELATCLPFLERLLVLAQPRHLLLMGGRPAKILAGSTIRANAGWQRPTLSGLPDGARALAMRHPAYLLSHLPARREAWADLLRLRKALDSITGA